MIPRSLTGGDLCLDDILTSFFQAALLAAWMSRAYPIEEARYKQTEDAVETIKEEEHAPDEAREVGEVGSFRALRNVSTLGPQLFSRRFHAACAGCH